MRKNIIYYGIAALAVLSLAACDKFLDKNPDNRTEVDTAEKAISLVGAAYSTTGYTCVTELMSDNSMDAHLDTAYNLGSATGDGWTTAGGGRMMSTRGLSSNTNQISYLE